MTKRSLNLIKEYRNYLWIPDKDGKFNKESTPKAFDNHLMDACRYAINSFSPHEEEQGWEIPDDTGRYSGSYY
jgi:hypothetical protein